MEEGERTTVNFGLAGWRGEKERDLGVGQGECSTESMCTPLSLPPHRKLYGRTCTVTISIPLPLPSPSVV